MDGVCVGCSGKFGVEVEGSSIVGDEGVSAGADDADVTLSADPDTFQGMMEGETNPTSAFMTGKLKIDGDMGMAMKLASALA